MQTVQKYLYHYIEDFSSGKQNIASINMYTKSMYSDLIIVFHCFFKRKIELPPFLRFGTGFHADFSSSGSP